MLVPDEDKPLKTMKAKLSPAEARAWLKSVKPASSVDGLTIVIKWFVAQDDVVRKAILGMLPKGYEAHVAQMELERIAKKPGGGTLLARKAKKALEDAQREKQQPPAKPAAHQQAEAK